MDGLAEVGENVMSVKIFFPDCVLDADLCCCACLKLAALFFKIFFVFEPLCHLACLNKVV